MCHMQKHTEKETHSRNPLFDTSEALYRQTPQLQTVLFCRCTEILSLDGSCCLARLLANVAGKPTWDFPGETGDFFHTHSGQRCFAEQPCVPPVEWDPTLSDAVFCRRTTALGEHITPLPLAQMQVGVDPLLATLTQFAPR